ncbi:MAG: carbon storage regulator [Bacillota bacterium]
MLVISRKAGESLVIGDQIKITITSLGNDKVTIGIDAPKDIKVVREELIETIEANRASNEKIEQTDYQGIASLLKNKKNNGNK